MVIGTTRSLVFWCMDARCTTVFDAQQFMPQFWMQTIPADRAVRGGGAVSPPGNAGWSGGVQVAFPMVEGLQDSLLDVLCSLGPGSVWSLIWRVPPFVMITNRFDICLVGVVATRQVTEDVCWCQHMAGPLCTEHSAGCMRGCGCACWCPLPMKALIVHMKDGDLQESVLTRRNILCTCTTHKPQAVSVAREPRKTTLRAGTVVSLKWFQHFLVEPQLLASRVSIFWLAGNPTSASTGGVPMRCCRLPHCKIAV